MHYSLTQFTDFLAGIDLPGYRDKYSGIKIVEMDLPRQIQALDTIYSFYWDVNAGATAPLSFETYYGYYYNANLESITEFGRRSGFGSGCDCFTRGLEARIYRTWASLITQVHAGYVAESVFGVGTVQMSTELDHRNIDILINSPRYGQRKIQIKKVTHRPEFARRQDCEERNDDVIPIWYVTPNLEHYHTQPHYQTGSRRGMLRESLLDFVRYNPSGTLDMLPNGFVVFTPAAFARLFTTA